MTLLSFFSNHCCTHHNDSGSPCTSKVKSTPEDRRSLRQKCSPRRVAKEPGLRTRTSIHFCSGVGAVSTFVATIPGKCWTWIQWRRERNFRMRCSDQEGEKWGAEWNCGCGEGTRHRRRDKEYDHEGTIGGERQCECAFPWLQMLC